MKKFKLIGKVTVSCFTEVEADTIEDAKDKAINRVVQPEGFGYTEDDSWIVTDYDGEPFDIQENS